MRSLQPVRRLLRVGEVMGRDRKSEEGQRQRKCGEQLVALERALLGCAVGLVGARAVFPDGRAVTVLHRRLG